MAHIKIVPFENEAIDWIRTVREAVFIEEQKIDPQLEFDGLDSQAVHAVAFIDGQGVATGRLLADGHIGRVAVLAAYRGQKLGSQVMQSLLQYAQQQNYSRVYLGAQHSAIAFYQSLGFTPYGETFMEANILHQGMEYVLDESKLMR